MKKYEKTYDWVWNEKKGDYVKKYRKVETPEESMVPERIRDVVTGIVFIALVFALVFTIQNKETVELFIDGNPLVMTVLVTALIVFGLPELLFFVVFRKELVEAFKRDILGIGNEEE